MKNSSVLITGAGGFIGSTLVDALLARGAKIRAMVHYDSRATYSNLEFRNKAWDERLEIVSGDVRDPYFVRHAVEGVDVVFHLAALIGIPYSYVAPASYIETNVTGTLNVLEACRSAGVGRLVHTSTSECYGTARYVPIDENHPLQGQSPYSASKIAADKLCEAYHLSFGLPVSVLRPFNTYGPRQSARAIIPTIISQLLWGGPEVVLGSLDPVRDFTFVADTCDAFCRIAECPAAVGKTIHLGTGVGVTIGELVSLLQRLVGTDKPVVTRAERVRPANSEVMQLLSTPALAETVLGWIPQTSLEEGLTKVVAFMKAHRERYASDAYAI